MKKVVTDLFPNYKYFYINEIETFKVMIFNDFAALIYFTVFYIHFYFL
ncbi:hypothetical protein GWK08_05185 [Leptobacterium flavescens]|uniref:Uncharacterized protein n=1 Tax=Leptobacterium flavescens TaxID=472055 RepID=A0A6P0UPI3_9FLAO|nr:hypothetical protein [Leptobacterium flavescens]NER12823.1 hypothetical protein [Leptobacterium flavescens]